MNGTLDPRFPVTLLVTAALLAVTPPVVTAIEGGPVLLWSIIGLALGIAYLALIHFLDSWRNRRNNPELR